MSNENPAIALVFDPPLKVEKPGSGVLEGKRIAVKDNVDIKGYPTGGGNPAWAKTHGDAAANAPCVDTLLNAGGEIVAKTQLDELAFSLMGANHHYGTPLNPAAPERVPGGSSSGSVSLVASGAADIGIGTDTGGSVRGPASFCGVYGLRPTHGRISLEGVIPLAPGFDTVGFFTRSLADMRAVASVFFEDKLSYTAPEFRAPDDMWALAYGGTRDALTHYFDVPKPAVDRAKLLPDSDTNWLDVFRIIQSYEAWQELGGWISANQPDFGPGVKERFEFGATLSAQQVEECNAGRQALVDHLDKTMAGNTILVIPTMPGPAPLKSASADQLDDYRKQALLLLCVSGLAGLPQLNLCGATEEGAPVGLSLVGRRGTDMDLIAAAQMMEADLGQ